MNSFFARIPGGRKLIVLVVILAVAVLGWWVWQISQFHIVKTDPKLSQVATLSESLTIYFSDEINPASFRLSDTYGIVSDKPEFHGKQVVIPLSSLTEAARYSLTVTSVKNTDGEMLVNQKLDFTTKDIPYAKLSKSQQQALVNSQDRPVYSVNTLNYSRFNDLLDYGITSDQLQNIKQALFDYSNVAHKQFWTMTLTPDSIAVATYKPGSGSTKNSASFSVRLNNETFRATIDYDLLADDVHLVLQNPGGATVFDSTTP